MSEMFAWGTLGPEWVRLSAEPPYSNGFALRRMDRRYWTTFFSPECGTLERSRPISFDGRAWRSDDGRVSMPRAVTDDFGVLVAV